MQYYIKNTKYVSFFSNVLNHDSLFFGDILALIIVELNKDYQNINPHEYYLHLLKPKKLYINN